MIYRTESVVVGGGPAGICAALALARQGKETALVTNRPVLGGNSSSEIRVWTRGATGGGNLYAEEMGIWGELKLRNLYLNPDANPVFWDDVLLEQVLEEPCLKVFFNTHIAKVNMTLEGDRIYSITGHQMGTEKEIEFVGEIFLDATGDGTIGAMVGVPSSMGKEERALYHESFAPVESENATFGNTIFFFTRRGTSVVKYQAPSFAYSMEQVERMLGKGGRIVSESMNGCDYWWFEMGGRQNTIADAQEIGLELKRLVAGVWNYIKNSGRFDADYLTLDWEGNLPGKRESRRMITEKVLCQQDVLERRVHEDGAFYGGWYLDFHPSDGVQAGEDNCIQIPVQIYQIPLRCLYNKKMKNLIFAGRDIGVSHVAFASTRIMNTCALSGQAAGTMAAKCLTEGCVPGDMSKEQIKDIQQQLLDDDMFIPGVSQNRETDLAKDAFVQVSSEKKTGSSRKSGSCSLKDGGFLIRPSAAGNVNFLVDAKKRTCLSYRQYSSELPSRIAWGEPFQDGVIELTEGRQWIRFPLLDKSCGDVFITTALEANPEVSVVTGEENPGFLMGHKDSPEYGNPYVSYDQNIYGGHNLINGQNRIWKQPNLWISEEEEQPWIQLSWTREISVKEILVFFNPDLNMELVSSRAEAWDEHHKYVPRTGMPPQLVKSAVLYGKTADGKWKELADLRDNWRRRWKISLEAPVKLQALRMEITSVYGNSRAEVFEIIIHKEKEEGS